MALDRVTLSCFRKYDDVLQLAGGYIRVRGRHDDKLDSGPQSGASSECGAEDIRPEDVRGRHLGAQKADDLGEAGPAARSIARDATIDDRVQSKEARSLVQVHWQWLAGPCEISARVQSDE